GRFDDCFLILEQLKGDERVEGDLIAAGIILDMEGDLPRARSIIDKIFAKRDLPQELEIMAHLWRIIVLTWEGNYDEALRDLEHAQKIFETLTIEDEARSNQLKVQIAGMSAWIAGHEGKHVQAREKWSEAIEIAIAGPLLLKSMVPAWHNNIGLTYENLGEWEKVLESFKRSMAGFQELGNEFNQAIPLHNMGRYYELRGENDRALGYFQRSSKINRKYNWKRGLAGNLLHEGRIFQSKGEFQRALDSFQDSLALYEEIGLVGWDAGQAASLYNIILLYLELQDDNSAKQYLTKLQDFSQNYPLAIAESLNLLAEALVLKNSNRFKEKSRAQDLLKEIIENEHTSQSLRTLAMLHLCDLLILEAKTFADEALFSEAQVLVDQVIEQAQTEKMIPVLIDTFILQAKFALIEGNAQEALNLLEKAYEWAHDKNLATLAAKTKAQQDIVEKELSQWQELAQKNAPLQERLELANLEEYLHKAIQLRELTSTVLKDFYNS
ncbi:MAG: tetratricopeptide repeat protein, partial [Candidatus Thorarchaeota archaeon]